MAGAQWSVAEEILQHQRPEIQGAVAEGQATWDERGRAACTIGIGWDAGKAAHPDGGRFRAGGFPGKRVGCGLRYQNRRLRRNERDELPQIGKTGLVERIIIPTTLSLSHF